MVPANLTQQLAATSPAGATYNAARHRTTLVLWGTLLAWFLCLGWAENSLGQAPETELQPPQIVDSPAIRSLKASNPQTAFELSRAAQLAYDLGRTDVAVDFLTQLIEAEPAPGDLVDAHRRLGSGHFIRFQTNDDLQPVGGQVANLVLEAAAQHATDPARLAELVQQLGDESTVVRRRARNELLRAHKHAANPLFDVLGDPDQSDLHAPVRVMLVELGEVVHGPLLAALDSDNPTLLAGVIQVCGAIGHRPATDLVIGHYGIAEPGSPIAEIAERALVQLAGNVPARDEVRVYLANRAQAYFRSDPQFRPDDRGEVEYWIWEDGRAVEYRLPVFDAQVRVANRLLSDLAAMTSLTPGLRDLHLIAQLHLGKLADGLDAPLSPERLEAFAEVPFEHIEEALESTLKRREFVPAATAACEILGRYGDVSLLVSQNQRLRPLQRALQSKDSRVRMAATRAVLEIDPTRIYAGASDVVKNLGHAATASGRRIVVIADPHQERANRLAGILQNVGFEPRVVQGGDQLFREAYRSIDVEFLMISENIYGPLLNESVQILRKDRRSADLPIAVLASPENLTRWELQLDRDPLTLVMVRPHDEAGFVFQAERLLRAPGRLLTSADVRLANAQWAMSALAVLAGDPDSYAFYDLRQLESTLISRLGEGILATDVAAVLGRLSTPATQTTLVDTASDSVRPLPQRQACVEAFGRSVQRRGILLTKDQILEQYDRYNRSESLDPETQALLGQILDIIEAPTRGVRFDQPAIPRENRE